jgi:hypothetical protein
VTYFELLTQINNIAPKSLYDSRFLGDVKIRWLNNITSSICRCFQNIIGYETLTEGKLPKDERIFAILLQSNALWIPSLGLDLISGTYKLALPSHMKRDLL